MHINKYIKINKLEITLFSNKKNIHCKYKRKNAVK